MEDFIKTLASSAGVCGLILGFHLIKLLPLLDNLKTEICNRLDKLTAAMNIASKTDLLRIAASPFIHPDIKDQATNLLKEVEDNK